MEGDAADELPLLEEVDAPALDERLIADEESRRDSRDTPIRQTPVIQSIHCGCYLNHLVDVKLVARRLWNAVFDPKRSQHGVLVSLRRPRVSVCVFPSGKVISMGAKSEASAILGCRKVARMIQRLPGYQDVRMTDFKVHNVTASGALGYRIDLKALARHPLHEDRVEYNPDQFPGLHYKLPDATATQQSAAVKAEPSSHAPALSFAPITATTSASASASAIVPAPPPAPSSASASASASGSTASASPAPGRAPGSSSLTLTLYFSGRFTLVGAQHELDVYRHFDHVSRALFAFSSASARQQAADSRQQPQQPLSYDAWLEASRREEQLKGGRMGWEEEADRVRLEMDERERRRAAMAATRQPQQPQTVRAGERGGEVRVKAEPGAMAGSDGSMRDERKEADGLSAAVAAPSAGLASKQACAASGKQQAADERKESGASEERIADERSEPISAFDSALVVSSQHVEEAEGDDDVEWE